MIQVSEHDLNSGSEFAPEPWLDQEGSHWRAWRGRESHRSQSHPPSQEFAVLVHAVTHCSSLIVSGSWCEHLNIFEYAKNQELTAEFLHSISNIFQTVAQGRSFCPASEAPCDASCECFSSTWQRGWSAPCEVIASWFWGLTQEFTSNTEIPKLRLWLLRYSRDILRHPRSFVPVLWISMRPVPSFRPNLASGSFGSFAFGYTCQSRANADDFFFMTSKSAERSDSLYILYIYIYSVQCTVSCYLQYIYSIYIYTHTCYTTKCQNLWHAAWASNHLNTV